MVYFASNEDLNSLKFMIKFTPPPAKSLSSMCCSVVVGIGALCQFASAVPAEVFINQRVQDYDGELKFPGISTNPPGLAVEVLIVPRSQSEVVFQTIPAMPEPSYSHYGLEALTNDNAFGEEMDLGGSNRFLESIEVAMVNNAKATSWSTLAGENSAGYLHPLSIIVYQVEGDSLTLLAQKTQQTLIPWLPSALDDGSEYPYGGIGFNARFDFDDTVELSGRIAVLVAYNTESSGFNPVGQSGPHNSLNVAVTDDTPLVGSDVDETGMLRFRSGVFTRSQAFGALAPIFTVRTLPANPSSGTPLDAGGYRVSATITADGYEGESVDTLNVTPLEASVSLSDMQQVSDGTPKSVSVTTVPSGLSANVVYARRSGPPVERGLYPVFVTLPPGNYAGKSSGTMRLGSSYESWIAEKVAEGSVPPTLADASHDPDLDGRTNFVEYLMNTNPGVNAAGNPPLLDFTSDGGQVILNVLRNNEVIGASYQLQVTDDLNDPDAWTNLTTPSGTDPSLTTEQVVVNSPFSPLITSEFFRLKVTTP